MDQVYNLACPASPPRYQEDPIDTLRTNVIGTQNVLEFARSCNAQVLQASTSEVYGDPAIHPQPETYWGNVNPVGPRACYDEGKRCAETLCTEYRRKYDLDVRIIRIFNTYGPRMDPSDGRVVSNFVTQALRGDDITVYGDGSQTRSFCYVDDLIEGMVRVMNVVRRGAVIGPVNLGNIEEVSVRGLAELIIRLIGSRSKICVKSLPADDPTQRRPDLTLAANLLSGWHPKISLEVGLSRTVAYFRAAI